jgi:hypothetical protein
MSWNSKGHYYICKSRPFVPMRRKPSTHSFATCFRTWRRFWTKSCALPRHVGWMFSQAHFLWFYHPKYVSRVLKFRHRITTCGTWGFLSSGNGDFSFLGYDALSRYSWFTLKLDRKFLWHISDHLPTCYFIPVRSGRFSNAPCWQTPSGHLVRLRMSSTTTDNCLWTRWPYNVSRKWDAFIILIFMYWIRPVLFTESLHSS